MIEQLSHSFGFLSGKLSQEMEQRLAERIQPYGISTRQLGLLFFVSHHPGMSQKTIGERIRVDRTTMVAHVDHLEDKKFLHRVRSERDRRITSLYLTSEGEKLLEKGWVFLTETEQEVLSTFTKEEQDVLKKLLQKWWNEKLKRG